MKKIVLIVLSVTFFLSAQSLTGKKFCLDPGHGSTKTETYEPETKRFETWANHIVKPYLKQYLENYGATVFSTRGDFDSLAYHTTLSEREAVANNNNVDYFQSIHHNAFNGASNYSLVLFEQLNANDCPVGNPQWPGQSDVMANIMVNKIQQALQTTAAYPRGDFCFLGYNLGVLNDLTMPGTLSESSFFDNLAERQRLSNLEYLRTEAEALFLSFLQYYNVAAPSHGSLVGFVKTPAGVPINGVSIIIESVNKTYLTDNLGNGFYRIDSLAPGTYTIKAFTTTDTLTSSAVVAGGKINVKNLSFQLSVGDVKMYAVLSQGDGIKARWLVPEGSVDSYYVYISTDGINFNSEPDYKTVNDNYTITGLTSGQSYYVKVKGKNSKGLSINFSKTYGAQVSSSSDKVLIVDGFSRYGGTGSYPTPDHNLLRLYGKSMDNLGMRYDAVSNSAIVAASILTQYKYVIWFTGDESTIDETFTTAEQNILKSYLNGGGKLFVTGSEIAWDLGNKGAIEDKDFFNNYFKSNYVTDNPTPNSPSAFGNTGSIFDSITVSFGNTYPEDWPDVIAPLNGASSVLKYNSTQDAGITYSGLFPTGTKEGRLCYIAFGFETIGNDSIRTKLLSRIQDFLLNSSPVNVEEENSNTQVVNEFSLSSYPNPFNPSSNILVNITEEGLYNIEVYNTIGEKVITLFNDVLEKGSHNIKLKMDNYPSGIYIVRVNSFNNKVLTHKLMLMK